MKKPWVFTAALFWLLFWGYLIGASQSGSQVGSANHQALIPNGLRGYIFSLDIVTCTTIRNKP